MTFRRFQLGLAVAVLGCGVAMLISTPDVVHFDNVMLAAWVFILAFRIEEPRP